MDSLWTLSFEYSYVIGARIHWDCYACYVRFNKAYFLISYTTADMQRI